MAGKEPKPQGYLDFWGDTPNDPTTAQGKTFAPVSSGNSIAKPRPAQLKGGPNSIQNQILQAADYYGPMIYQKLGFFSSLELSDDQNLDFIPISQTKANTKLFVVGIIPPSTTITGRLLDRSASISSVLGSPTQILDGNGAGSQAANAGLGGIVTASGYQISQGSGSLNRKIPYPPGGTNPNGATAKLTSLSTAQVYSAINDAFRNQFHRDGNPTELQIYTAQCLRETQGTVYNNNFGFMGASNSPPKSGNYFLGPPEPPMFPNGRYYRSYDTVSAGASAFLARVTKGSNTQQAAQDGDVLGYLTSLAQNGYYEASVDVYYHGTAASPKNGLFPYDLAQVSKAMKPYGVDLDDGSNLPSHTPDNCAFKETNAKYRERVAPGSTTNRGARLSTDNLYRFMAGSTYDDKCPLTGVGPQNQNDTNGGWFDQGSVNASAAAKDSSKTVDLEDLNKSQLGQKFQRAQLNEILATQMALDTIKNTPPLQLLVNPQSFKLSSEKIISDGGFTREGPIIEHWGEQQDKLEASGKLAAFMAIDANPPAANGPTGGGPGLTRVARNYSASYQNFLSLYLLYRNNGGLYVKGLEDNLLTRLSLVGSIYIYYDSVLYIGSFDSFSITETDSNPYSLEYSFQFTVRASFKLDNPTEDNYQVQRMFQRDPALNSNDKQFTQQLVSNTGGGPVAIPSGFTGVQG
jgi:hypothetical protein